MPCIPEANIRLCIAAENQVPDHLPFGSSLYIIIDYEMIVIVICTFRGDFSNSRYTFRGDFSGRRYTFRGEFANNEHEKWDCMRRFRCFFDGL